MRGEEKGERPGGVSSENVSEEIVSGLLHVTVSARTCVGENTATAAMKLAGLQRKMLVTKETKIKVVNDVTR